MPSALRRTPTSDKTLRGRSGSGRVPPLREPIILRDLPEESHEQNRRRTATAPFRLTKLHRILPSASTRTEPSTAASALWAPRDRPLKKRGGYRDECGDGGSAFDEEDWADSDGCGSSTLSCSSTGRIASWYSSSKNSRFRGPGPEAGNCSG